MNTRENPGIVAGAEDAQGQIAQLLDKYNMEERLDAISDSLKEWYENTCNAGCTYEPRLCQAIAYLAGLAPDLPIGDAYKFVITLHERWKRLYE